MLLWPYFADDLLRLPSRAFIESALHRAGFGAANDRQTVGHHDNVQMVGLGGMGVIYQVEGKHLPRKQAVSPIESSDSSQGSGALALIHDYPVADTT